METHFYRICPVPADLPGRERWAGFEAIGNTERDGPDWVEVRHDILSTNITAQRVAEAVRSHWSIENQRTGISR